MTTVLHIYDKSDHARSIFEGEPIPMVCGVEFYFETVNGHPIIPSGGAICSECLDFVGPEVATQMLTGRKQLTSTTGDHQGG